MISLMKIIIPYCDSYLIAYAILNGRGACVIRFELQEGFVSSREKGK